MTELSGLSFAVFGRPQPQGSSRAFAIKKAGAYTGRAVVTSDNPTLAEWKARIALAALAARTEAGMELLITSAVAVEIVFVFERPAGHYGSGRNAEVVKPSAPRQPAGKPDLDKLVRAALDGCTGVVWRDDSQVTFLMASKQYGTPQRADVTIL